MFVIVITSLEFDPQVFGPYLTREAAKAASPAIAAKFADADESDDLSVSIKEVLGQ